LRSRSLPRITIPVACTADWNAMRPIEPDGRARLCGACDRPVYDTRSMTRANLELLIYKHEGALPCLRLHRRPDGTIVTKSCFAPVLRAGRFLWLKAAVAAVAFWSAVFALWSWVRRPAPTAIDWDARAEAETRKVPFVIKPPDDSADWEDGSFLLGRPRMVLKPQAKKAVPEAEPVEIFLGGADLEP
jgi:hypothetical protein